MSKVFIIAEAGVNHNGSISNAKKLIETAKEAGADAVKFQMFHTENLVTKSAPKANYQKIGTNENSQFKMLKGLELSEDDFLELMQFCENCGIKFMATPFDNDSADFLNESSLSIFKISSGDLNNIPFLKRIAKFNKPIILSTGMADLEEIKESVEAIYSTKNEKLTLLHCTSNYPAEYNNINLLAIQSLKNIFNIPVGYSDHSKGIEVAIAAVALGSTVIEKHFTLSKQMDGPDHKSSIESRELKKMVTSIRNIEKALGNGTKKIQQTEIEIKKIVGKSLVASIDIPRGTLITKGMITVKRPGIGIAPKYLESVIGKVSCIDIPHDTCIEWSKIK